MCFYYDGMNDVTQVRVVRARKEHRCSECVDGIRPGEFYEKIDALFEGYWNHDKLCARCHFDRARIFEREMAEGCGYAESWPPLGELDQALADRDLSPSPITYREAAS